MKNSLMCTMIVGGCLLGLTTGCANKTDYDSLQAKVQTQDQQLRQMQPNMADSWAQVQAMRQEINALKGQLDEFTRAGGTKAFIDKVNKHDAALRQVENSLSLNFNLDAPSGSAYSPAASTFVPGNPTGMTAAPTLRATAPTSTGVATPPAAAGSEATQLYNAGIAAFNARQYSQAQASFVKVTEQHPKSSHVGNAWYYVGDCSFQLNKFNDAAVAYDKVITGFPRSTRAPAAYLKQAICFSKLGQKAAATARMQELMKKYPTSAEAARAKSFLQTNK